MSTTRSGSGSHATFDADAVRAAVDRIPSLLNRDDPTGTTDIREDWIDDSDARWATVMERVVYAIAEDDAFGIDGDHRNRRLQAWGEFHSDPARPMPEKFVGSRGEQLAQFRDFLENLVDDHVVTPTGNTAILNGQHWTADYLRRAELSGVRAAERVAQAAGYDVSDNQVDAERVFSPQDPFSATGPVSRERWFYETYQELRGAADAAIQQAVREVSQALQGPEENTPSPSDLADAVVGRLDAIGQTRTQTMVLTFTVELHNNARLARFKLAGFTHVVGLSERVSDGEQKGNASDHDHDHHHHGNQPFTDWSERNTADPIPDPSGGSGSGSGDALFGEIMTAGDQYVCDDCQDIEGDVYPIEQAFAVLPVHLGCRCSFFLLSTLTAAPDAGGDYTNLSHPSYT